MEALKNVRRSTPPHGNPVILRILQRCLMVAPWFRHALSIFAIATTALAASPSYASPHNAWYVVAEVGNDAREAMTAIGRGANPFATIQAAALACAGKVGDITDDLRRHGARHFLVFDNVHLGLVPVVTAMATEVSGLASLPTWTMNQALAAELDNDSGVTLFDTCSLLTRVVQSPDALGLSNAQDACGALAEADCSRYLFRDGLHLTAALHQVIAEPAFAAVVLGPPTLALLAAGLLGLARISRRRHGAFMRSAAIVLLPLSAVLTTSAASAQQDPGGPYVRVSGGRAEYDYAGGGFYASKTTRSTPFKLGAGYRWATFAAEAWLADFGSAPIWDGAQDLRVRSVGVGAMWSMQFASSLQGFLRAGASLNTTIISSEGSKRMVQPSLGIGLALFATPTLAIELTSDFTVAKGGARTDSVLVNDVTGGLRLRF